MAAAAWTSATAVYLFARRNGKTARCVCGHPHPLLAGCLCGCTVFELDDGTDTSPTRTGNPYHCRAFEYNKGRYGGRYSV